MSYKNSKHVIALGFVLVLGLLAAVTAVGLSRMMSINGRFEAIGNNHSAKTDIIFSMRDVIRERFLHLHIMSLTADPFDRDERFMRFNTLGQEFLELRERLVATGLTAEEQAVFERVLAVIAKSQPLQASIARKLRSGDTTGVDRLMMNDSILEQEIAERFDEIVAIERKAAQAGATEAARTYRNTVILMLILGVAGLTLGGFIAYFVIGRTGRIESALFREKEQAEVTLQAIGDGVITTDAENNVAYLNPIAEQLTGWSLEEARGKPLRTVYNVINEITREPIDPPTAFDHYHLGTMSLDKFTVMLGRHREEFAIEGSSAPIRSKEGRLIGAAIVFRDVTEPRSLAQQLIRQASHDALTGLVNRRKFEALLQQLLDSAKTQNKQHAVLYMDLDQFKVVNDTCGHIAGDELLRQLALLLQSKVRNSDTLARLGGDEFGVLLEGCPLEQAHQIANQLREAVQDFRFVWQAKTFKIGVSIGLVNIDDKSSDLASIMSAADSACYIAKEKGRNRIWVHQADGAEVVQRHGETQWISRISDAFEDNRFRLYRQTVMPLVDGKNVKYDELLLRMIDEYNNLVIPTAFIPAAERYGIMPSVDRWVIRKALNWLVAHPNKPGDPSILAVNLSGQSLCDEYFLDFVIEQFALTQIDPKQICFEVTETAAIANWGRALYFISTLKEMGCSFALDDFGSGMSSFAYLKSLPVDFLKIDGAFVRDIDTDRVDLTMVEAITRLGHVMNMKTIAESVESDIILQKVRELGVDYVQGSTIHVPEPLEPVPSGPYGT